MGRIQKTQKQMHDRWVDRSDGRGEIYKSDDFDSPRRKPDLRERLTDTAAITDDELEEDDRELGRIIGNQTGEEDFDTVPGGWEGTDDATSTAPSDLTYDPEMYRRRLEEETDVAAGRAYGGGLGIEKGGVSNLCGSPVEESRDWEHDPSLGTGLSG